MIFDIAARSLASSNVLIPVEELLGDCTGSRMPEVDPERLSFDASQPGRGCVSHFGAAVGRRGRRQAACPELRRMHRLRKLRGGGPGRVACGGAAGALRRCQIRAHSPLGHCQPQRDLRR